MSLRTKMMLSIFVFMGLVLGLLTLNLWLHAATKARAEAQRNADLMARIVSHWVRESASPSRPWTEADWDALFQKLAQTTLVSGWTVAGLTDGALRVVVSSETDAEKILREEGDFFRAALGRGLKIDAVGSRVYVPVETPGGRYAARLALHGSAVPAYDISDAMQGILTIMAVGTVLLMVNAYVFINRLVLRPLGTLVEASNRVAGGDFSKRITVAETYDEMGRMIGAFNIMIDRIASHHRQAEAKITATERQLFAAQRLSTTGTLAAGIAHEINNPLGGMMNAAQSLRDGRLEEAKRAEYLELIADGLGRVRAIVQKILQFRPRPFEPRPVRLREIVDQAVAFLQHRTKAKEVEIRNELPDDLHPVSGDPLELQQAFLNVLMNAVDACVVGEGVITVTAQPADRALGVRVADNGCGMGEEDLSRCMDPFFTTKDVGEGTGLGLSVAQNIMANHGGKIDIESERGRGTAVTLTFPLREERAGAAARSRAGTDARIEES